MAEVESAVSMTGPAVIRTWVAKAKEVAAMAQVSSLRHLRIMIATTLN